MRVTFSAKHVFEPNFAEVRKYRCLHYADRRSEHRKCTQNMPIRCRLREHQPSDGKWDIYENHQSLATKSICCNCKIKCYLTGFESVLCEMWIFGNWKYTNQSSVPTLSYQLFESTNRYSLRNKIKRIKHISICL